VTDRYRTAGEPVLLPGRRGSEKCEDWVGRPHAKP